jgi:NTE family protein
MTLHKTDAALRSRHELEGIALALSGGGSRAMAFHLGCLRGLHEAGLLDRVNTLTAVSGGSVLAAIYCSHPGTFEEFEIKARQVLAKGFVWPAIIVALTTPEGLKALFTFFARLADKALMLAVRILSWPFPKPRVLKNWLSTHRITRNHSRTTILRKAFDKVLANRTLADLRSDRPRLIIVACELRAKAAFYFTSDRVHCWRYGSAPAIKMHLADAVCASAAYPLLLPALEQVFDFEKDGKTETHRITLTDGGVYDNLGLAPLWPGRDPQMSLVTGNFQQIIVCRGGYGIQLTEPSSIWPCRMAASFLSVLARNENGAINRLFDLRAAGKLKKILVPHLDQRDDLLAHRPVGFVTKEAVAGYPTDFAAMPEEWIDRLSLRGEQLVIALLKQYWERR